MKVCKLIPISLDIKVEIRYNTTQLFINEVPLDGLHLIYKGLKESVNSPFKIKIFDGAKARHENKSVSIFEILRQISRKKRRICEIPN